jgi:hypothetical protein
MYLLYTIYIYCHAKLALENQYKILNHVTETLFVIALWINSASYQTTLKKKLMLGYNNSRLKSSFCKFVDRNNHLVCDYKLSMAHMLKDLFHTICWTLVLTTCNPVYLISTKGTQWMWPVGRGCLLLRGTCSQVQKKIVVLKYIFE